MQFDARPQNPPAHKYWFAQFLFYLKMAVLACLIFNFDPFAAAGIVPTPAFFTWAVQHKMHACIAIWFLTNMLEGSMMSTGAFEVKINQIPVWSKIESGRLPEPPELLQAIENTLQITTASSQAGRFS